MAKKIKTKIKLQIPGAAANPAPPVGPALGQHGLNIAQFCKEFNDKTPAYHMVVDVDFRSEADTVLKKVAEYNVVWVPSKKGWVVEEAR